MEANIRLRRAELLNMLIGYYKYQTYLEIGVSDPTRNFDLIRASFKVGVDPVAQRKDIIAYTSDQYFASLSKRQKFDLIFIDGLHHSNQVYKDINNALDHLNEGGFIVCHDMLPANEEMQKVPRQTHSWTGDCWKAWAYLRMTRQDLEMFIIKADHGLGVIKSGQQILFPIKKEMSDMDFNFFVTHQHKLMNTFEVSELFDNVINE